jgi:hypothetical protein
MLREGFSEKMSELNLQVRRELALQYLEEECLWQKVEQRQIL